MAKSGSSKENNSGYDRKLLYGAIVHGHSSVLSEYNADPSGSAKELSKVVLEKIVLTDDNKLSFLHGNYSIHYITRPSEVPSSAPLGLTYIVVMHHKNSPNNAEGSSDENGRRVPFLFLLDLESIFRSKYLGQSVGGSVEDLRGVPGLDKDLQNLLERADRGENDVSGLARQEIEQVKTIMIENVERVLERGERINLLVSKTDRMNNAAVEFRKRSNAVKKSMRWANIKFKVIVTCSIIFLIYLMLGILCGLPGLSQCLA